MKEMKNIFSLCIGMVLRKSRERRGWKYDDLAARTGIKPSYILAFEKANAVFHISKAYALYTAFVTNKEYEFNLNGLVSVFFLISYTDSAAKEEIVVVQENRKTALSQKEKNDIYNRTTLRCCTELMNVDASYKPLLRPFLQQNIFSIYDVDKVVSLIEDEGLDAIMNAYVQDPINFGLVQSEKDLKYSIDFFSTMPTLYVRHLNNVKSDFQMFPVMTSMMDYAKWFNSVRDDVREVTILTTDEAITPDSILSKINWDVRLNSYLQKMKVFVCNKFQVNYLLETIPFQYIKHKESMREQLQERELKMLKEKLEVHYIDSKKLTSQFRKKSKNQSLSENLPSITTVCVITIADSLPVGFLITKSEDKVINLTVEEVGNWIQFVEHL